MARHAEDNAPPAARGRFGIAALQLVFEKGDNFARIAAEVAAVKKLMPWVGMVVVGELATFGANPARAEAMPGRTEQRYGELARKTGVWLIPGSLYERRKDGICNTAPVIDPNGEVVARYRKQFPFLPYEKDVVPGREAIVFDVPEVGRFGMSICYDMWFPETTRSLASLGAQVILHPTMTYTIDREVELCISRAAAATNQCYFVDVNVAGELGNGRSIVCGPGGEVIHQAGSGREIIAFEVDTRRVRDVRECGWNGLGQPLKSFRDSTLVYPAYGAGSTPSKWLNDLGPVEIQQARREPDGA